MRFTLVVLVAALAGCTGPVETPHDLSPLADGGPGRCPPGDTQPCTCLGGGMGAQTCRANGQSWGPCIGCGPEESDGPLPTVRDGGNSPCGDCDGCCDGATCVPFASQTNGQCGQRGADCGSCGFKICDTGTGVCLDASGGCSSGTCPNGCCKMVGGQLSCQIDQPTACGTGGGTCTACTPGVTCDGSCTDQIDANYKFKVYVRSLVMDSRDTGGVCWDSYATFSCPDFEPKVCFGYQSGSAILEGCTDYIPGVHDTGENGQVQVSWGDPDGLIRAGGQPILFPGSLFIAGGQVRIRALEDDDVNGDDVVGSGYYTPVTTLSVPMKVGAFGHVHSITFELR